MMIAKTLLLLAIAFSVCIDDVFGRVQSAGAKGKLLCNGKPAVGVSVKLWDNDVGLLFDPDDKLDQTTTNSKGFFQLQGHEDEYTTLDPKINIDHECDDILPCKRRITIKIPDGYVNDGSRVKRYYDAGTIELSGKFSGEVRDCLH